MKNAMMRLGIPVLAVLGVGCASMGTGFRPHGGWYDWDPGPQFITHYTGRVVANLASPDGALRSALRSNRLTS